MLDARNIFRVVTRKINDFSSEQLKNITATVELYRGNNNYFIDTITDYFNSAVNNINNIKSAYTDLLNSFNPLYDQVKNYCKTNKIFGDEFKTIEYNVFTAEFQEFEKLLVLNSFIPNTNTKKIAEINKTLHKNYALLKEIIDKTGLLKKATEHTLKNTFLLIEKIQVKIKLLGEKNNIPGEWKQGGIRKKTSDIELGKNVLFETIANAKYFGKEIKWLQSRFPDAVYNDVLGLCKVVSMDEIAKNDYSLTPGRYVGVEPKADDNFDFAERLNLIHLELELLNDEASELAKVISQNFKDLGI